MHGQSKRARQKPGSYKSIQRKKVIRQINTKDQATQIRQLLRDERQLRMRLQNERALLLEEILPRILDSAQKRGTNLSVSGPLGSLIIDSAKIDVVNHQTGDACTVAGLVGDIFNRRLELALQPERLADLEKTIKSVQKHLLAPQPNSSAIHECLRTLRNVLEGAVGSTLASVWIPTLTRFLSGP